MSDEDPKKKTDSKQGKGSTEQKNEVVVDVTGSMTESEVQSAPKRVDDLVGPQKHRMQGSLLLLAKEMIPFFESQFAIPQIKEFQKLKSVSWILGPVSASDLEGMLKKSKIPKGVRVSGSAMRWRSVEELYRDYFEPAAPTLQDLTTSNPTLELTGTAELSEVTRDTLSRGGTITKDSVQNMDLNPLEAQKVAAQYVAKVESLSQKTSYQKADEIMAGSEVPSSLILRRMELKSIAPWLTAAVAIFIAFFIYKKEQNRKTSEEFAMQQKLQDPDTLADSQAPDFLKELAWEQIYQSDSSLMAKLRPYLIKRERGERFFSDQDENQIKRLSDPATASWELRMWATNLLAIQNFHRGKYLEAQRQLTEIVEGGGGDAISFINTTLLTNNPDLANSREWLLSAQRLCSDASYCWIPDVLLAGYELREQKLSTFDQYFKSALSKSNQNPLIYGMILDYLTLDPQKYKKEIAQNLKKALWADPDHPIDSPLKAPIASELVYKKALEGLKKAAALSIAESPSGILSYIDLLESLWTGTWSPKRAKEIEEKFLQDSNYQAQVLGSYLAFKAGSLDAAAESLTVVLPLLESTDGESSWPWSLAGDIQMERGQLDRALVHYHEALGRNSRSPAALLGMALILKKKKDYSISQQRFSEAAAIDSTFMPARLRMSRKRWQSLLNSPTK